MARGGTWAQQRLSAGHHFVSLGADCTWPAARANLVFPKCCPGIAVYDLQFAYKEPAPARGGAHPVNSIRAHPAPPAAAPVVGTGSRYRQCWRPEHVGSSSEQGAPLQMQRSHAPLCLILEQKQTITPLTCRPRNAKYAVSLSLH